MNRLLILIWTICVTLLATAAGTAFADNGSEPVDTAAPAKKKKDVPPVMHSAVGDRSRNGSDSLRLEIIGIRQQYSGMDRSTYDNTIFSPKSALFSPDGSKLYDNSLEGCHTTVFSVPSLQRQSLISYSFPSGVGPKWSKPSGYYTFTHYDDGDRRKFVGKPVEGTLSHNGRYLWVTFYRRSFDINAQDPSAVAVIDTRTDSIVRMFETGPLPKMIAASPDNRRIAVTHWGDNTVGLIDISAPDIKDWHHLRPIVIGQKLKLDHPLDKTVNRDANSGNLLRGKVESCKVGKGARTLVISPDGRYLFVACNTESALYVVDTRTMKVVDSLTIDSYPVGLAISPDGTLLAVTSQGREGHGGNALNLVRIIRPYYEAPVPAMTDSIANDPDDTLALQETPGDVDSDRKSGSVNIIRNMPLLIGTGILLTAILSLLLYFIFRKRK